MAIFRVMSYHITRAKATPLGAQADRCCDVIRSVNPDLIMLQGLTGSSGAVLLSHLAEKTGMQSRRPDSGGCVFLSHQPLHNLQVIPLGFGHDCIRADLDHAEERVHLYNLTLSLNPVQRMQQVTTLLSDQILHNRAFPCATIICGDFGLPFWGCGKVLFNPQIVRAGRPLSGANYPAPFPFWGRGRIYLQGPIRTLSSMVIRTDDAIKASMHLPLFATVETSDTRRVIKVNDLGTVRRKQVDPVCG